MICQSGAVSPSPKPLVASLLVTRVIFQVVAELHESVACTRKAMLTIRWLGGQRTLGVAVNDVTTGGVVSTTVTKVEQANGIVQANFYHTPDDPFTGEFFNERFYDLACLAFAV